MRREGGVVSVSRQRGFIVAAGDNQYTKSLARRSQNRVRAKRVTELCKVRSGNGAGPVARHSGVRGSPWLLRGGPSEVMAPGHGGHAEAHGTDSGKRRMRASTGSRRRANRCCGNGGFRPVRRGKRAT